MDETTMQRYKKWFVRFAALVLGFQLVVAFIWDRMNVRGAGKDDALMATLKNAADITEINNLESHYANALDSGRLGEVADLWTPTGGFGYYTEDPVTTRLALTGTPVTSYKVNIVIPVPDPVVDRGAPLKDFAYPGCLIFGRENLRHFLQEGGNSPRPHFEGWAGAPDGGGPYPGTRVSRHVIINRWIEVTGDKAVMREYYGANTQAQLAEVFLVRTTSEGWRFQFRRIILAKRAGQVGPSCRIADPKFPIPPPGSFGGSPNFVNPD